MGAKSFATQMRETIEDIKSQGTAAIYCDNIIAYLRGVENSPEPEPTPQEIELYKASLQHWIDMHNHAHESDLEMFRSVITAGQSALKSAFLLNGGAAVALLAFIAHLAQFAVGKVPQFAGCLLVFALGVLAAAATSGCTYLSQWLFAGSRPSARKVGFILNIICILVGIGSYGLFAWGLLEAYDAFVTY